MGGGDEAGFPEKPESSQVFGGICRSADSEYSTLLEPMDQYAGRPGAQKGAAGFGVPTPALWVRPLTRV
jgi:hypothetical protein